MPLLMPRPVLYSGIYWEEYGIWDNIICQSSWDNDRILPKHTYISFLWLL